MRYALLLILSVRRDGHDPCVNAVFLGLAMWNDVHDALPAAAFVEERCESLLSHLSCITTKDKAARSVKDWGAKWRSLRTATRPGRTSVHLRAAPHSRLPAACSISFHSSKKTKCRSAV